MVPGDGLVSTDAKNVGGLDRKLRAVTGTLLVSGGVVLLARNQAYGAAAVLAGAGLLFNVVAGFCAVNALLGIDTCSRDSR